MPRYEVEMSMTIFAHVEVEAANEEEAANSAVWEAEENRTGDDGWQVEEVQLLDEDEADPDDDSDPRDGTVEAD